MKRSTVSILTLSPETDIKKAKGRLFEGDIELNETFQVFTSVIFT